MNHFIPKNMRITLRDLGETIASQKYFFSMAFMSRMIFESIGNLDEYFNNQFPDTKYRTTGMLKKSHQRAELPLTDMEEFERAFYIPFEETIKNFKNRPSENIYYFNSLIIGSIIYVGDLLDSNKVYGYRKKDRIIRNSLSPEIEFMRHIRNGIAHGNRITLLNGQPHFEAKFNRLTISEDISGMRVIPLPEETENTSFIDFGDVYELFDVISYQLCSM